MLALYNKAPAFKVDAHAVALKTIYPGVFGTDRVSSIPSRNDKGAYFYELRYRGEIGVCATTVCEIFRAAENAHYRSITLTHTDASGAIADQFHHNTAQLLTQGFFDHGKQAFAGPLVVVSLADVLWRVQTCRIPFKLRNIPRTVCTYVEVLIDDLKPFALLVKEY